MTVNRARRRRLRQAFSRALRGGPSHALRARTPARPSSGGVPPSGAVSALPPWCRRSPFSGHAIGPLRGRSAHHRPARHDGGRRRIPAWSRSMHARDAGARHRAGSCGPTAALPMPCHARAARHARPRHDATTPTRGLRRHGPERYIRVATTMRRVVIQSTMKATTNHPTIVQGFTGAASLGGGGSGHVWEGPDGDSSHAASPSREPGPTVPAPWLSAQRLGIGVGS